MTATAKQKDSLVSKSAMEPPKEWPQEVIDEYEPIRTLGKGGFASVVLARRRRNDGDDKDYEVAIKVVAAGTQSELGYAHREAHILQELSHPRVMRLVKFWEQPPGSRASAVMALSYAKGPTLDYLLRKRGAPHLLFCRVTMSQLVDVIAYLHSHAVLHRDIKPDNLIVTGASVQHDDIWDDSNNNQANPNLEQLRKKWHVTLIDFGFARALSKKDIQTDGGFRSTIVGKPSTKNVPKQDQYNSDLNEALDVNSSMRPMDDGSHHSQGSTSRSSSRKLDRSYSRVIVRKMSALGNRNFAAPEVMKGVTIAKQDDGQTLSPYVSDYGMVADAFSVGATIRYTVSGVPPEDNIEETIAAQNHPMAKAARWLGKKVNNKKSTKSQKKKCFRSSADFPPEVTRLVKGLTHWNPKERTTVRTARLYHWVNDALEEDSHWTRREVEYLKCSEPSATTNEKKEEKATVES